MYRLENILLYKERFIFGSTSWGGDYSGKTGFGLPLNQLYPQTKLGDPNLLELCGYHLRLLVL